MKSISSGLFFKNLIFKRLFLTNFTDINLREFFSLIFLIIPVFFLGINPCYLIDFIEFYFYFYLTLPY